MAAAVTTAVSPLLSLLSLSLRHPYSTQIQKQMLYLSMKGYVEPRCWLECLFWICDKTYPGDGTCVEL